MDRESKHKKGWSDERRAAQAERCRANKPWKSSTGPRSEVGKEIVSRNALKHGADSRAFKALRKALKENGKALNRDLNLLYYAQIGLEHENKLKKHSAKSMTTPPPLKRGTK